MSTCDSCRQIAKDKANEERIAAALKAAHIGFQRPDSTVCMDWWVYTSKGQLQLSEEKVELYVLGLHDGGDHLVHRGHLRQMSTGVRP